MAKQTSKPVKSPPVTSHPLFSAVVALWFGALFGLGSLAVRPTLLESLVLKSHIDLIIPATAPPLGVTARILISLMMAGLGAVIGIALARRITRPKIAEPLERKRSAKDLAASVVQYRARDAHPDAPARAPILAHEEFGSTEVAPAIIEMRRRALANEDQQTDFVPREMAPLPGVSTQILDISEIGPNEPEAFGLQPQDLSGVTQQIAPLAQPSQTPLDWANALPANTPAAPTQVPAAIAAQHQMLQTSDLAAPHAQPSLDHAQVLADGRQVFGMTPPPQRSEQPRQIFGVDAIGDHVSQDFVKAAGYQTTVFDVAEPSPLFAPRAAEVAPAVAPERALADPATPSLAPTPMASPAELGMTDLATRLADAMRRRRAAAQAKPPEQTPEPAAEPAVAAPIPAAYEPAALTPDAAAAVVNPTPVPAVPTPSLMPHSLPSAMRPLALDAFLEEDATLHASLIPPRYIAMPGPAVAAPPPLELVAELISEDEPAEVAEEENYGSLLGLAPTRSPFVRVDDPAAYAQAAEPVVIFPGQAPRFAPEVVADDGSFRRFDAPSSAVQGQPLAAATNAPPSIDPAEAERALRAALSNLQRMSGAA